MIGVIVGYLMMGLVGNYLHHAFHIKDIWLTKYAWFHELRSFHYIHHLGDARQNYAVLNMSIDRWLGSLSLNVAPTDKTSQHEPLELVPGTTPPTETAHEYKTVPTVFKPSEQKEKKHVE